MGLLVGFALLVGKDQAEMAYGILGTGTLPHR